MTIKVTVPNTSNDSVTFGSANTPTAAQVIGIDSGSSNGQLAFNTTASGTSTERMRIDASGNVGIGTSSPAGRMHTVGASGVYSLIAQAPSTSGTYYHQLFKNDSTDIAYSSSGGGLFAINTVGATPLVFGTNATERARIDSRGNLLVGATSSATTAKFYVTQTTANGYTQVINALNNSGTRYLVQWQADGTAVGAITSNGSTTTYGTTSDYRLKENIAVMTDVLDKVAELKPVTYTWKADGAIGQGFIAHELQAVIPECVVGEKDAIDENGNPIYQNIDTSFLVATLTAAIQELNEQQVELKAIVDTQAAKIAALEAK
jgi:hypothetical protein